VKYYQRRGSMLMDRTRETMYYNVGMPTHRILWIWKTRNTSTILEVPKMVFHGSTLDATEIIVGLGEANRTSANYTESIIDSLYKNPDIYNSLATINNPFKMITYLSHIIILL
jgi:hypothetical protein